MPQFRYRASCRPEPSSSVTSGLPRARRCCDAANTLAVGRLTPRPPADVCSIWLVGSCGRRSPRARASAKRSSTIPLLSSRWMWRWCALARRRASLKGCCGHRRSSHTQGNSRRTHQLRHPVSRLPGHVGNTHSGLLPALCGAAIRTGFQRTPHPAERGGRFGARRLRLVANNEEPSLGTVLVATWEVADC
jgi:hypothetical protein